MPARTRLHGRGVAVIPPRACYVTFAGDPRGSDDFDLEDVAAVRTIQSRPSRMDTGITADKSSSVPHQASCRHITANWVGFPQQTTDHFCAAVPERREPAADAPEGRTNQWRATGRR